MSTVLETNKRTFLNHWTGDASIVGSGDDEHLSFTNIQYMESEIVEVNSKVIELLENIYGGSGDTVPISYRTASLPSLVESESWTGYTVPFAASVYVQVRLDSEATSTVQDVVLRYYPTSVSPSASPSNSPSLSPSASESPSASLSPSNSPSLSPSASLSPSMSPSLSPSASESPSLSPSLSPSASESPSVSPSLSSSESPSESESMSESPSVSPSESPSS